MCLQNLTDGHVVASKNYYDVDVVLKKRKYLQLHEMGNEAHWCHDNAIILTELVCKSKYYAKSDFTFYHQ